MNNFVKFYLKKIKILSKILLCQTHLFEFKGIILSNRASCSTSFMQESKCSRKGRSMIHISSSSFTTLARQRVKVKW